MFGDPLEGNEVDRIGQDFRMIAFQASFFVNFRYTGYSVFGVDFVSILIVLMGVKIFLVGRASADDSEVRCRRDRASPFSCWSQLGELVWSTSCNR